MIITEKMIMWLAINLNLNITIINDNYEASTYKVSAQWPMCCIYVHEEIRMKHAILVKVTKYTMVENMLVEKGLFENDADKTLAQSTT